MRNQHQSFHSLLAGNLVLRWSSIHSMRLSTSDYLISNYTSHKMPVDTAKISHAMYIHKGRISGLHYLGVLNIQTEACDLCWFGSNLGSPR